MKPFSLFSFFLLAIRSARKLRSERSINFSGRHAADPVDLPCGSQPIAAYVLLSVPVLRLPSEPGAHLPAESGVSFAESVVLIGGLF